MRSCYLFNRGSSGRCDRLDPHHGGRRLCSDCSKIALQLGIGWIIGSRGHKEDPRRVHARYNVGGRNATLRIGKTLSHKTSAPNAMLSPTMAHFVSVGLTANATPSTAAPMGIATCFLA